MHCNKIVSKLTIELCINSEYECECLSLCECNSLVNPFLKIPDFLVEIFIKFRSTIDYVRARIMTATPATFIGVDDDDDDYDTDVVQSLSISTHSSTTMIIPLAGAAVRNDIIEK